MRLLTLFGLGLSTLWLVGIPVYIRWGAGPEAFFAMSLNEQGDFFAGLFAPLALLWLVIGYFQQGRELAQNSEALRQQAAETQKLASQAKIQAEEAQRQAEGIAITADQARRDTFFRMAELMERDLASLAAELYEGINQSVQCPSQLNRAWEQFGNGNRSALASLVRAFNDQLFKQLVQNGRLNRPARRFLTVFDKILLECEQIDEPTKRPLSALYEYSDNGELYGALCSMLDRSPKWRARANRHGQ